METSLKLQMDVKNNAEELRRYMLDLQNWEEEMKEKDNELKNGPTNVTTDFPPPRNKIKRNNSEKLINTKNADKSEKKVKKIQAYDYSAWDKYDADKACKEVDEDEDEPEAEEAAQTLHLDKDSFQKEDREEGKGEDVSLQKENREEVKEKDVSLKNIDEAFYEKEMGNQFVRKGKWEDAIACYTKSIELDPRNAIYYSNRAICFIKVKNFRAAEADATIAIQLDKTYAKAYQRRALARTALGQLQEAHADYEEILKLEPNNSLAASEMSKLDEKIKNSRANAEKKKTEPVFNPRSIFKKATAKEAGVKPSKDTTTKLNVARGNCKDTVSEKESAVDKETEVIGASREDVVADKAKEKEISIHKPNHSGDSKNKSDPEMNVFGCVPEGLSVVKSLNVPPHLRSKKPLRRITIKDVHSNSETIEELNQLMDNPALQSPRGGKAPDGGGRVEIKKEAPSHLKREGFSTAKTFVQFEQDWKLAKTDPEVAHSYLKKMDCRNIQSIFGHSLESGLFGELLAILSHEVFSADSEFVVSFLRNLARVERFGSLLLFMSSADKQNLELCIANGKRTSPPEEIDELYELYELTKCK